MALSHKRKQVVLYCIRFFQVQIVNMLDFYQRQSLTLKSIENKVISIVPSHFNGFVAPQESLELLIFSDQIFENAKGDYYLFTI